ncbi:ribulose-phosphate 3-epimerase [uncultured Meiothermus sp.]|jgi:ribulose-phosphate 3-epimerase|uniref:ribulose-phosphate 3-epimerase n=1 Tax=uncultured Meiothermus sp. TaxID=157471 RepID=UPI0026187868|nr:ribulose-phosphate 3-epimerase [uncultured Meiothermus sp.]
MPQIAPSILAADFTRLGEQVLACAEAGADLIHVDVMDGRFVPNISMGLVVVEALRRVSPLPLDVHLMIVEPERYIADFARAGAHYLTFHPEATPHVHRVLQQIKEHGVKAGMAVNPGTPLEYFEPVLSDLDLALLMTVNPGFGGQKFIERSLERLKLLKPMRDRLNPACLLEVDGGINRQIAPQVVALGADILVAGSAVFEGSIQENIAMLRESYAFAG